MLKVGQHEHRQGHVAQAVQDRFAIPCRPARDTAGPNDKTRIKASMMSPSAPDSRTPPVGNQPSATAKIDIAIKPGPEGGHGLAEKRQRGHHVVRDRVLLDGGIDADGHRQQQSPGQVESPISKTV